MLRKRTRSHPNDQKMGLLRLEVVSDSQFSSNGLSQKHKTHSLFNVPGVLVGLSPKGLDNDSVSSPTSPLDFRVFSKLGNPFRFPKSSKEECQKIWGYSKVGLSIVDEIIDEPKPEKVLRSSDSKNIFFGAQMGIKCPNVRGCLGHLDAPKSLPNSYAGFSSKLVSRPSNLHILKSDIHSEKSKISLGAEFFGNSGFHIRNHGSNVSSGSSCLENRTSSMSLPCDTSFDNPNVSSSMVTKLTSGPILVGNGDGFINSLSAIEIEHSEDYTCVKTHGPNPKTTHIFSDCILECHRDELTDSNPKTIHIHSDCFLECRLMDLCKNEIKDFAVSPVASGSANPIAYPSTNYLSFCYSCKKKLEGEDIYMYRGEKAFCSWNCRLPEILFEEALEKTNSNSENNLESNKPEELLKNFMFIAP